jgi:hypothetical protein
MTTRTLCSLILATAIAAPAANADIIEHLVFTGTATCESGFFHQECTPGSVGPLTGTYTLDVTTQQIVGPWSFTSPFASFSSTAAGASAPVYDGVMNGSVSYDIAEFQEVTSTFVEVLSLGFTGAGAPYELGPIATPAPITVIVSGLCQNVPGVNPAGCEPDVNIAGATNSVPEPGSVALIATGIALMGTLLWFKRVASKVATCPEFSDLESSRPMQRQ